MRSFTNITPIVLACAISCVTGQSTPLQVAAIKAHFSQSGIVPSLLQSFNPLALLDVSFSGVGSISPGQLLTQSQVQPQPSLSVTPLNSSILKTDFKYTVAMVDAGPVGYDQNKGQTRHWLVNSATITNSLDIGLEAATDITKYAGPAPPKGDGPHRYVILVYNQPSTFKAPNGLSKAGTSVALYDFPNYVKESGLGSLLAGTYFDVETGTATASLSPTFAVVTSTLDSGSTGSSASTSVTGSSSGSSPSSTSQRGSATSCAALRSLTFIGVIMAFFI